MKQGSVSHMLYSAKGTSWTHFFLLLIKKTSVQQQQCCAVRTESGVTDVHVTLGAHAAQTATERSALPSAPMPPVH